MSRLPRIARTAAAALAFCASLSAAVLLCAAAAPAPARAATTAAATTAPRPPITQKYIPFGARRKAETATYNKRHYHQDTYVLTDPRVVVLHFTAGAEWQSAWNTFAADSKYMSTPGLWEYPGVSAHFIVCKDGTIIQCLPLSLRGRHAIGLNWTAIGIEIVQEVPSGKTGHWADQQILHRTKQVNAVVHLVRYLQGRFHIKTSNVTGHAMANSSPYFKDYTGAKTATGDWVKQDVLQFRARL
jgi:N-acetyl-anhydromuramyl-L-alanine amidase AmpD